MEITMRVEIYYSPVVVPKKKDTTQLSLSLKWWQKRCFSV